MKASDARVEIAGCILDHFEFCTDHQSAANCAASEIVTKMKRGWFGPCGSNVEAGLERCSEVLHCEPTFAAVIVAIEELAGDNARAKKMIAELRHRKE